MIRTSSALPRMGTRIVPFPTVSSSWRCRVQPRRHESTNAKPQADPKSQAEAEAKKQEVAAQTPPITTSLEPPKSQPQTATPTSSSTLSSEPQKSLPGPTWLWLEPFRAYGRVHQRRPLLTQFVSALVIYLVGDFVAQGMGGVGADEEQDAASLKEKDGETAWPSQWIQNRDWHRTSRALLIGGLAAVPGYKWFLWLSNSFNYRSKIFSLTVKVLINQSLFTPLFNTYFFGMQHLLSNPLSAYSLTSLATHIQNTVPQSWFNSCKIWPAVTAFSFAFVPLEYRSLVAGVVAIGWQTYLSLLDQRAKRAEREKRLASGEDMGQELNGETRGGGVLDVGGDAKCAV